MVLVLASCFALAGCSRASNTGGTTSATSSSEETAPRSGPSRSEIACHLHSCAPPFFCNRDKGICEQLSCVESQDCPYGYKCDFSKNVCQ